MVCPSGSVLEKEKEILLRGGVHRDVYYPAIHVNCAVALNTL